VGQYKVPQNVEAEDQIIGPLTFKQFIYALIGVGWALLSYAILRAIPVVAILVAAPVTILFFLLAFFRRNGQNFEQLLIAIVGFVYNTRSRVWRKDNIVETFRIEATPAVTEQSQVNPNEVRSELERIATLIDSRGWNQPAAEYNEPSVPETRIIMPGAEVDEAQAEIKPVQDILDLENSPLAQNLAGLIQNATNDMRREAISTMHHVAIPAAPAPAPAPAKIIPEVPLLVTPAAPAPSPEPTPPVAPEPLPDPLAAIPLTPTEVTNPLPTDILKSPASGGASALTPGQPINIRQDGN
jgi:hypothetical protein